MLSRYACGFILAVSVLWADTATADGLIFKLPSDGTWVSYAGETAAEIRTDESALYQPVKVQHEIRVSSVGTMIHGQRPCRWIELDEKTWLAGKSKDDAIGNNVRKVLVPERYLSRGQDLLNHAIYTFWNPKDADREGLKDELGFDRFRYETDRFLQRCPPPLTEQRQLPRETVESPMGRFEDCEVITGKSWFDRPTKDGGRWEYQSVWKIYLHDDAPFGVVRLESETAGKEVNSAGVQEAKGSSVYTVSRTGDSATSQLDLPKKRNGKPSP